MKGFLKLFLLYFAQDLSSALRSLYNYSGFRNNPVSFQRAGFPSTFRSLGLSRSTAARLQRLETRLRLVARTRTDAMRLLYKIRVGGI